MGGKLYDVYLEEKKKVKRENLISKGYLTTFRWSFFQHKTKNDNGRY